MTEILFRGQSADTGDWIKGFYVRLFDDEGNESHRIYSGYAETDCEDWYPDYWEVVPDTIGRFTGLTDKNGKKIFEGDIVKSYDTFGRVDGSGTVFWSDTFASWHFEKYKSMYGKNISSYEVIGNIHDNTETF